MCVDILVCMFKILSHLLSQLNQSLLGHPSVGRVHRPLVEFTTGKEGPRSEDYGDPKGQLKASAQLIWLSGGDLVLSHCSV